MVAGEINHRGTEAQREHRSSGLAASQLDGTDATPTQPPPPPHEPSGQGEEPESGRGHEPSRGYRVSFLFILALSSLAFAQGVFRYSDQSGSLVVNAKSAQFTQAAGPVYRFTLSGNVIVDDKGQGLKLASREVTLDAVPSKADSKKSEIRKAVATGGVQVTKTVTTPRGGQVTKMSGSKGDYTSRAADGLVNLAGPVTLTNLNSGNQQSMVATGSTLVVNVEPKKTGKRSGLRTATLSGSVKLTIVQAPVEGQKGSTMVATGNRMILDNLSTPPTLTLSGNVNMDGRGPGSFGTFRGLKQAVLTLNDKGEWTSFRMEGS